MTWRKIPGADARYEVNEMGEVRSVLMLKQSLTTWGYKRTSAYIGGNRENQVPVHRLVALAFIPNPENKPCVNHINSDRSDNRVENLEWVTHKENSKHASDRKRLPIGEDHHNSRLSNSAVIKIKSLVESKTHTLAEIAAMNGVSVSCISYIARGYRSGDKATQGDMTFCSGVGRKKVSAPVLYDESIIAGIIDFLKSGGSRLDAQKKFGVTENLVQRIATGKRLPTEKRRPRAPCKNTEPEVA